MARLKTLMARLTDPPMRHGAVRLGLYLLMRTHGKMKVSDVAQAVDLSQRRFGDVFTMEVGLTPKLFGRVQRFQRVLAVRQSTARVDWAQIAVECGYCDQAHLIRDFVEFSGVSPSEYWRRQTQLDRAGIHVKRHHLLMAG
jgi:transcriptional regulator GlxA family with amidase domain